jgi:hypothetical protein
MDCVLNLWLLSSEVLFKCVCVCCGTEEEEEEEEKEEEEEEEEEGYKLALEVERVLLCIEYVDGIAVLIDDRGRE